VQRPRYRDLAVASVARTSAASVGLIVLLGAQLCVLAPNVDLSVAAQFRYRLRTQQLADDEFSQVVERVRAEPGEVLANPMDVIVLADRPILLEPVVFSVLSSAGKWDPSPLVQRICAHEVTLFVTNNPLEQPDDEFQGITLWPGAVHAALRQVMSLERQQAGRYVYVARHACTADLSAVVR
jgi:hypothetical protein